MSTERLYLDHAASTPLSPWVYQAMQRFAVEFGNPSSLHAEGRKAKAAIDSAREVISNQLGCLFGEVIFTSSGTEAAAIAILGTALHALESGSPRRRILFGAAEHHCVLHTAKALAALGFSTELIPCSREAVIDPAAVQAMVDDTVLLTCVMHANNELGTIQPVKETAAFVKGSGSLFFCDAVQTFCTLPTQVDDLGVDFLSVSAHKIYGPKGAGALYMRGGLEVLPIIAGGGQERDQRAGTENTAAIAGFGVAVDCFTTQSVGARDEFFAWAERLEIPLMRTVFPETDQLPGHAHFRIPGIPSDTMLIALDRAGIAASSGAACSSGSVEPSHVLSACGYSPHESNEGIRFTFGSDQGEEVGKKAAEITAEVVKQILASRTTPKDLR